MFGNDQRREVRRGSIAADAQSFSLQLLLASDSGTGEYRGIIETFHSRNQRKVKARQVCLYDLADAQPADRPRPTPESPAVRRAERPVRPRVHTFEIAPDP